MSRDEVDSGEDKRVESPSILSTQLKDAPTGTPQGSSAETATALASPEPVAEQADTSQEESEQLSTYARLQAALDDLSPLLERANAALIGPSLDSSELAKVGTCPCITAEPVLSVAVTCHVVRIHMTKWREQGHTISCRHRGILCR